MLSNILILIYVFANISANGDFSDNYRIIHRGVNPFDLEPEVTMTLAEMVAYYGYPFEVHQVTTEDGYILNNHRIPHGKDNADNPNQMPILLFQGAYLSSDAWVSNTPDKSIGFLLADAGFDVWMLNKRGNVYSQKHVSMDSSQEEYWHFSCDELVYDAVATIDDVINKTGMSQVSLIGYSLGGRTSFATLSKFPDYNNKIKAIYALSPVGNMADVRFQLLILADIVPPMINLLKMFGIYNINLTPPWIPRELVGLFAKYFKSLMIEVFTLLLGPMDSLNSTRMPIIWSHCHGGGPGNIALHLVQLIKNPGFRYFDWGKKENLVRFRQETPPDYDLKKVTVPVHLYHETHGYIISEANVQFLYDNLANAVSLSIAGYNWNHASFLFSTDSGIFFKQLIAKITEDALNLS